MATFNKDKLTKMGQSIAGPSMWHYTDTGVLAADLNEAEFFTTGYDNGIRKGDVVMLTEGDTGLWAAGDATGGRTYMYSVVRAQDTGATQVKTGLGVLVGDTS